MKPQTSLAALALFLAAERTVVAITFDEWRADHFTPAELNDAGVSGELAEPDGDGRSNYTAPLHNL